MKEDILQAMVRENAFCRVEIEWCHYYEEINKKPYWLVYFVSANVKDIRYPIETARGPIRQFKSIDAAYTTIGKITEGRVSDIRIIPEPWWGSK